MVVSAGMKGRDAGNRLTDEACSREGGRVAEGIVRVNTH
jgi:hypothetical protein